VGYVKILTSAHVRGKKPTVFLHIVLYGLFCQHGCFGLPGNGRKQAHLEATLNRILGNFPIGLAVIQPILVPPGDKIWSSPHQFRGTLLVLPKPTTTHKLSLVGDDFVDCRGNVNFTYWRATCFFLEHKIMEFSRRAGSWSCGFREGCVHQLEQGSRFGA